MRYVTYDPTTGSLTGCYSQSMPEEHLTCSLAVPEDFVQVWTKYRMNKDRTAVELIPED